MLESSWMQCVDLQWCSPNAARRALQFWHTVELPLIYWNINERLHVKTFNHPHGAVRTLSDVVVAQYHHLKLCTVLNKRHSFPALPTSWCTAACLPLWSAAACSAWSCCEPLTFCRCERRCRGSRSCWPSGCSGAARPWALWTLTSRPSSSVWRRHQWCTPAGGGNPEINTQLPAWGRRCAIFLNP